MRNEERIAVAAALGWGIVVWIVVAALGGKREAWDADIFWTLGLPLTYAGAGLLGWLVPRKAWRWGVLPPAGQFAWMVATSPGPGALAILGLAYMAVLSLPGIVVASVCAGLRARKSTKEESPS